MHLHPGKDGGLHRKQFGPGEVAHLLAPGKGKQIAYQFDQTVDTRLGAVQHGNVGVHLVAETLVGGYLHQASYRSQRRLELVDHRADEALLLHREPAYLRDIGERENPTQGGGVLRPERDDAGHVAPLADGELAHSAVFGRCRQLLGKRREGPLRQGFTDRLTEHLLLGDPYQGSHRPVRENDLALPVHHKDRVPQRRHQRMCLGLLLGQREQAGLMLPAQTLRLHPGLLVAGQGFHHAYQVFGGKRLGQEEVDPLPRRGDSRVDVRVRRDHAGHRLPAVSLDGLEDHQAIDVWQTVVEKRDVVLVRLEQSEGRLSGFAIVHAVALELEDLADPRAYSVLVIHDQYLRGVHRVTPCLRKPRLARTPPGVLRLRGALQPARRAVPRPRPATACPSRACR